MSSPLLLSLFPLLLSLFSLPGACQTVSYNYTLATVTSQLEGYSRFDVQLHNHLLSSGGSYMLEVRETDVASYSVNNTGVLAEEVAVSYQNESSSFTIWNYQSSARQVTLFLNGTLPATFS
jgi:hypothetical protein